MNTLITMMMLTAAGMAVVIAVFSWKKWGRTMKTTEPVDVDNDSIVMFVNQIQTKDKNVS